ncbi:MAG: DUF2807 domain-containing protein [Caulobacter sp.]|nr:DUF2807 domain-containing protein [Caulobacter sp.]
MIRNLIVIAVASFILTVACLAGVAALGGRDLMKNGWTIPASVFDDGDDNVSISIGGKDVSGPETSRDLAWTGGDALRVDIPADVAFTQGDAASVTVTGPQSLVERVVVVDGSLRFADDGQGGAHTRFNRERLRVTIVAPGVKRFIVNGSPSVTIEGYDQPDMAIEINGSGSLTASGKTQSLALTISGSGDADLGGLETQDASVSLAGSGDAELSPKGAAQVAIAGSGDVTLLTKPASLSSNIDGSGDLHLP